MAAATQATETETALGIPGVTEPSIRSYEATIWSCEAKAEVRARLWYSLTGEDGRTVYRLLCIQPL